MAKSARYIGKIIANKKGYGFFSNPDLDQDVFINQRDMQEVMHGDEVEVDVSRNHDRRYRGSIVRVVERHTHVLVGTPLKKSNKIFLVPRDARYADCVFNDNKVSLQETDRVIVEVISPPAAHRPAVVAYKGKVSKLGGIKSEIDMVLLEKSIPVDFTQEAQDQALALGECVQECDKLGREDLTKMPFCTIDGESARDFDDAVLCKKSDQGFELWVAIADVSHYVQPDSSLDEDAVSRGTSIYFPNRVIPMLPESLSNGLCSLNPKTDRLVLVCHLKLDEQGNRLGYQFSNAVIHSHARLTYTQAQTIVEHCKPKDEVEQSVMNLHALFRKLEQKRKQRYALDFISHEAIFNIDDAGQIVDIKRTKRNTAHRMIEEAMLLANTAAAEVCQKSEKPALYRVHETPSEEKADNLRAQLASFNLNFAAGTPKQSDYAHLLAKAGKLKPIEKIVHTLALRSQQKALYQSKNIGHFGLAYDEYTHFTSPIRRYPDLLVHRAIKYSLKQGEYKYNQRSIDALGVSTSQQERTAEEISRDVSQACRCLFMKQFEGDIFAGTISAVTAFGVFIELDKYPVEGLLHVRDMSDDYYQFDASCCSLVGNKRTFKIGDTLEQLKIAQVSLESKTIDLLIA